MKEELKTRITQLQVKEQAFIAEITRLEKGIIERRASLLSIRGGIIELNILLKTEEE